MWSLGIYLYILRLINIYMSSGLYESYHAKKYLSSRKARSPNTILHTLKKTYEWTYGHFHGLLWTTTLDGIESEEDIPIADFALLFFRFDRLIDFVCPIIPLDRADRGGLITAEVLQRRGNGDTLWAGEPGMPYVTLMPRRCDVDNWLTLLVLGLWRAKRERRKY